jgi:hypothetical protein
VSLAKLMAKFPRPASLSDPHNDFNDKSLRDLLSTPDEEMVWSHYKNLLGPFLPAGTYQESVYFLPRAFEYLKSHEESALDLITSVIWFASEKSALLERDGLLESTRACIRDYLNQLTKQFKVLHFDRDACVAKGWGLEHFDYVLNCEAVCEGTTDLVRFSVHADLATEFVNSLALHGGDPAKAAWFLAYANSRNDVYTPPDYEPIPALLSDRHLLEQAAGIVRARVVNHEPSPTYWNDTFASLEL